jgi:hypothetical protein
MVHDFIKTTDPEYSLILPDRLMINQCFYKFRELLKNQKSSPHQQISDT